jgi:hypothetical protein
MTILRRIFDIFSEQKVDSLLIKFGHKLTVSKKNNKRQVIFYFLSVIK